MRKKALKGGHMSVRVDFRPKLTLTQNNRLGPKSKPTTHLKITGPNFRVSPIRFPAILMGFLCNFNRVFFNNCLFLIVFTIFFLTYIFYADQPNFKPNLLFSKIFKNLTNNNQFSELDLFLFFISFFFVSR